MTESDRGYDLKLRRMLMADIENRSTFDMGSDPALEARLDAEAEVAYTAGRYVEHGRVREWLMKLSKGERLPPPRA
jgi:hypothetical protein